MKIIAARRRDIEDIRFLLTHLGLGTVHDALAVCTEVFPDAAVPDRAVLVLDDAFSAGK